MEPFKNIYNKKSILDMASAIAKHNKKFLKDEFVSQASKNIGNLEMKPRVVQIAQALNEALPGNYEAQIKSLLKSVKSDSNKEGIEGFLLWPYTYFIEIYGLDHFSVSMDALYHITQEFTGEFGIRPFFERQPKEVYALFKKWVKDPNEHVRRWVSEGLRPNLPWGMNISHINNNLKNNIKLLQQLKNDPSLYVRKSVANHLNDICAIDADLVLDTIEPWTNNSAAMKTLIKQALRNLLKQGHPRALKLLGFDPKAKSKISDLSLSKKTVKEGDSVTISFTLSNESHKAQSFMVDYVLHYVKANGSTSAKVFKLKQVSLDKSKSVTIQKKQSFKAVTTRKHYPGKHQIDIQVNGQVKDSIVLNLK